MIRYKKIIITLVALLAVTAGAWAQEESLLTTIVSTGDNASFKSGSKTFDNIATVSFSNTVKNDNDKWGWYYGNERTLTVTAAEGYTITRVKFYTDTSSAFDEEAPFEAIMLYDQGYFTKVNGTSLGEWGVNKIEVYGYVTPAPSGPEVAWDKAEKTGSFTMPGGNVTLEPEYFAVAEFTDGGAPTGIADIKATTDDGIVKAGTVKNIGSSTTPQGTVMYYAVQSATAPTAPDYDATGWTDKVPTATDFAEGNVYVWYYVKGADGDAESTFSDGAITKLGETGYVTLAAPPTYAITLKEGTEESDKWDISPTEATKGSTITAKYSGERKVKSVKAVKKKAEPAAIINGKFSVSATKQVYFSKGNLRYVSGAWSFFDNQYDYYATYSADAWDKFGWSNSTNNFGMSTSTVNTDYQGDLVDWGTVPGIGSGWYTLSISEWGWLFNTRSASTVNSVADARYAKGKVNGVYGIILFPDTYTHPAGVTLPVGINEVGDAGWNGNNYSAADWTAMETAGCVFLPATGYREGTSVQTAGSSCSYRSSTRVTTTTDMVNYVYFAEGSLKVSASNYGRYGQCVRLVQDVK